MVVEIVYVHCVDSNRCCHVTNTKRDLPDNEARLHLKLLHPPSNSTHPLDSSFDRHALPEASSSFSSHHRTLGRLRCLTLIPPPAEAGNHGHSVQTCHTRSTSPNTDHDHATVALTPQLILSSCSSLVSLASQALRKRSHALQPISAQRLSRTLAVTLTITATLTGLTR